jgi:hypothetical protein
MGFCKAQVNDIGCALKVGLGHSKAPETGENGVCDNLRFVTISGVMATAALCYRPERNQGKYCCGWPPSTSGNDLGAPNPEVGGPDNAGHNA